MYSPPWPRLLEVLLALGLFLSTGCSDSPGALPDSNRLDALADSGAGDQRPADQGPMDGLLLDASLSAPQVKLPRASITPSELGLIINESDPQSVAVGAYYQTKQGIPAKNVVRLKFDHKSAVLSVAAFSPLKAQVDAALGKDVQALALTWMWPYRVGCMSITSAFALGWDQKYCNDKSISGKSCGATAAVPYYKSTSTAPFTDHGIRPAMMLAAVDEARARQLIDRGLAAQGTFPASKGYLIRTTTLQPYTRYVLQGQNPKTLQWEAAAPEILIKKYLLHEIVVSPVKHMSYKLAAVGS